MGNRQTAVTQIRSVDLSAASAPLWLAGTVFLALFALYFVGIDQGAVSLFGSDSHVHEFVHMHAICLASPATEPVTWRGA